MRQPRTSAWVEGWTDDDEGLRVLVPGLMGAGFLLSMIVLAVDWFSKKFPLSERRRRVAEERSARGRVSDITAVVDGSPPRSSQIQRIPQPRSRGAALAILALIVAAVAGIAGFEAGIHVGPDRRAWVVAPLVALAALSTAAAVLWLVAAAAGGRTPQWLRPVYSVWPLGTYPDFDKKERS